MRVNFSVTNQLATPSIHAAALANRPTAGQPGRLFVDTDNPSTGIYRDTGTVWENITGGAGAGNLQTVTDAGNTTDNNILLTYADNTLANALVFYNDQLAQEEYLIEKRSTGITTNDSLAIQSRGNISPSTNPVGFLIDGANDVIKTFYGTAYTEQGLKLDFFNTEFNLGFNGQYFVSSVQNSSCHIGDFYNNLDNVVLTIQQAGQTIKSTYQGNEIGLKLDFVNWNYYLGDFNGVQNSAYIYCNNDTAPGVYAYSEGSSCMAIGLWTANLGDWSFAQNGTIFNVNDISQFIKTKNNGNDIGLMLDFANDKYWIGDVNGITNNVAFTVDGGGNEVYSTSAPGQYDGLWLDYNNRKFTFGDANNNVNNTYIIVDDTNQRLEVSGNLASGTAGGSSGQHLKIRVGGVDYKIALLNP